MLCASLIAPALAADSGIFDGIIGAITGNDNTPAPGGNGSAGAGFPLIPVVISAGIVVVAAAAVVVVLALRKKKPGAGPEQACKFCPKCGTRVPMDTNFCPKCGRKLENVED